MCDKAWTSVAQIRLDYRFFQYQFFKNYNVFF